MDRRIYFDHVFTNDPGHRFWRKLERHGFTLNERTVEHPGKMFCRFIMIRRPGKLGPYSYLEFVNVRKGGDPVRMPGISLAYDGRLARLERRLRDRLKIRFHHKNYEWKKDSVSRLPGWNFLDFPGLKLRGLFPWFTEYEKRPKTQRPLKRAPRHANGVDRHVAFELELNPSGQEFFTKLLGAKVRSPFKLACGTEVFFTQGRRTRVSAVVLKCRSLKRFLKNYGADEEIEWRGKPAALLRNPAGMWDVIVI